VGSIRNTANVYATVLRNRSIKRVQAAYLLFNAEEYAVWIAVLIYAYQRGGATEAGVVAFAQLIPAAIFAPIGAVAFERIPRDRALSLGYALQAVATAGLAAALWVAPAGVVYAFAIAAACCITLTRPVHHSIMPELSRRPEELTAGNSISGTVEGIGVMVGPIANALLIDAGGPALVCAVFAALAAVAALLTRRLQLRPVDVGTREADPSTAPPSGHAVESEPGTTPRRLQRTLRDVRGVVGDLRAQPGAPSLVLLGGAMFVMVGALDVLSVLLAIDVLGVGDDGVGLLTAAVGIGWLVGAAAVAVLVGRRSLAGAVQLGVIVTGAGLAAVATTQALGPAMGILVFVGGGHAFADVAGRTILQRAIVDDVLTRIFGLQESMISITQGIGSAAAPILVLLFGSRGAFVALGIALVGAALITARPLRTVDRAGDRPDPGRLALLRSIAMFQPLPAPTLERVVRDLIPVRAPASAVLIRQGERGDRLYIIESGGVAIEVDGREVARSSAGTYFGEIALLRDAPRMATVWAVTDVALLALDRVPFLTAVTGSPASVLAADAEADRRIRDSGTADGERDRP
jgi:predicted MFS family arabinose efflux permease